MLNNQSNPNPANPKKKFDLADRTFTFGVNIVNFSKKLPQDHLNRPMINQLIRSGTSIGANYAEADEANSKKDFINKIVIAKKEAKETRYWLKLIATTIAQSNPTALLLFREAEELTLIFSAIVKNSQK
jgi:four helix bundle protein